MWHYWRSIVYIFRRVYQKCNWTTIVLQLYYNIAFDNWIGNSLQIFIIPTSLSKNCIRKTSATNFLQTAPIYWVSNPLTLQFCKTKKRHKMGWMFLRIQIWFLCTNTFSVFKSYFSVLILFDLWYKMNRYQPNIHIGKVSTTSKKSKPFYKGFVFIARVFLT